jgi:hypothetical protein
MNQLADNAILQDSTNSITHDYHGRAKRIIERFVRTAVLIDDDWPALAEVVERLELIDSKRAEADSPVRPMQAAESEVENEVEDDDSGLKQGGADVFVKNMLDIRNVGASGSALSPVVAGTTVSAARLLQIQDDFVRRGVIFTGVKYTKADEARGPRLAKNADILILDWNFAGDSGAGAMKILRELNQDGQLRFVCIFTDQRNLLEIKNAILRTVFGKENDADERLDFPIANFVFTLRHKPVPDLHSEEISQVQTLFDDAIGNIANHYSGFVQLSILEMSSHHRHTMMTHLARFSRDFDSAILAETAQKDSPVDMGTSLRALLLDEWRVALESSAATNDYWMLSKGRGLYAASLKKNLPLMTSEFIEACASAVGVTGLSTALPRLFQVGNFGGIRQREFDFTVGEWLEGGAAENLVLPGIKGKQSARVTFALLYALNHPERCLELPTATQIYRNLMRLDALFSQQLTLPSEIMQGTILKYDSETYFICITPLCDSARYTDGYNPYMFLEATRADESAFLEPATDYCVFVEVDDPVCLHVDIKRPHVFEINNVNKKIAPSGRNIIDVRYRTLPPQRSNNKIEMEALILPSKAVAAAPLNDTSQEHLLEEQKNAEKDLQGASAVVEGPRNVSQHETIRLSVVGQLRTDFFLMFSAAAASNSARVGVNRVEFIRAAKSK